MTSKPAQWPPQPHRPAARRPSTRGVAVKCAGCTAREVVESRAELDAFLSDHQRCAGNGTMLEGTIEELNGLPD